MLWCTSGGRTFDGKEGPRSAQRFKAHEEWLEEESDVTIRLGRLKDEDDMSEAEWTNLVCAAEALLIHWHSPPYNSQYINHYPGPALHIQNWGKRGSLLPECSTDSVWEAPRPGDEEDS